MTMLDLNALDLGELAEALEDHSDWCTWYFNRVTGAVRFASDDAIDDDDDDIEDHPDWIFIDPIPSRDAYEDMAEFVRRVPDHRAANLLARAIEGRGAFRRFKDTLFEFDELRAKWFAFHDTRMRRRAIAWLAEHDVIDGADAERAIAGMPDPPIGDGVVDAREVARLAAEGLRDLYGPRLVDVRLFGSHARGEAGAESDLDLLVVLDRVESPFEELRCMDDLLWRLTERSGITVSGFPVSFTAFESPHTPTLIRAKAEAVTIR
jgi:predicted nucleotidyltransferase